MRKLSLRFLACFTLLFVPLFPGAGQDALRTQVSTKKYTKMEKKMLFGLLVATLLHMPCGGQAKTVYTTLDFSQPDMKWRPIPLWFWNNTTIEGSQLEKQLEEMVMTDYYGGGAILPFGTGFRPEYLSPEYFTLYGRAIEKARSMGARMSVYDEYGFPSGSMGAINGSGVTTFKNNHPEATVKRLDKSEFTVTGGTAVSRHITLSGAANQCPAPPMTI